MDNFGYKVFAENVLDMGYTLGIKQVLKGFWVLEKNFLLYTHGAPDKATFADVEAVIGSR